MFPFSQYVEDEGFFLVVYKLESLHFSVIFFIAVHFFFSSIALLNWVLPPVGTFKVNVHAVTFHQPVPNGNIIDIGVVLRTSKR